MKLIDHTNAYNSLTNFEYQVDEMTGNGNHVKMLKFAWKNSWNHFRWIYFLRVLAIWNHSATGNQSHQTSHNLSISSHISMKSTSKTFISMASESDSGYSVSATPVSSASPAINHHSREATDSPQGKEGCNWGHGLSAAIKIGTPEPKFLQSGRKLTCSQ